MSRKLTFEFDGQKFANASAYLVERCPDVTRMKLAKLLYFADKLHLRAYGQPILGDRYVKMQWGPVPSMAYTVIKHDENADFEATIFFDSYLTVNGNSIQLKAPPNPKYLSDTNREVLDHVIKRVGHLTPAELSNLSHREPAWKQAELNREMDYRLMFADGDDAKSMHDLAQEDQTVRDAIGDVALDDFIESM